MHTPSDDAIRDRAYALWIEAGSPEGNDLYFWHAAEQALASAEAEASEGAMAPDQNAVETSHEEHHTETVVSETPEQHMQH